MAQFLTISNAPLEDFQFQKENGTVPASVSAVILKTNSSRQTGKFPKSARLLTSSHYKLLHRQSSRLTGMQISMHFRQGRSVSPKLGITVSRKYGKAHERNRFKRVVREAFRELYTTFPSDLELNISPRSNASLLTKQAVLVDLQNLIAKILSS